jgi:hypothetical protein
MAIKKKAKKAAPKTTSYNPLSNIGFQNAAANVAKPTPTPTPTPEYVDTDQFDLMPTPER